jgi:hypothetical protein
MGRGRTRRSALVGSLLVFGMALRFDEAIAQPPPERFPHHIVALTTSQNLLATDPNALARFLEPDAANGAESFTTQLKQRRWRCIRTFEIQSPGWQCCRC